MSINNLPNELLEQIFCFLNGCDFVSCSQVCLLWRNVTQDMLRLKDWWREFCLKEMPKVMVEDICGNVNISSGVNTDWYKTYKRWYSCKRISSTKPAINIFPCLDSTPITCCKISGSWILTGHRNGSLCAWSLETGDLIRIVTQHLRMVTDFVLFDQAKLGFYNCTFHESPCGHQFAVSISKDHNINISPLLEDTYGVYYESRVLREHSDSLESIKIFESNFAVLCSNNTLSVWSLEAKQDLFELPSAVLLYHITGPNDKAAWISFWNNQVGCLCKTGCFAELDIDSETWLHLGEPEILDCYNGSSETYAYVPKDYTLVLNVATLFWKSAIFVITADNRLWVSMCGSKYSLYPIMPVFHSYVISVSLRGPLLALGLENGLLILFHAKKPEDLQKVHLLRPVWQKKLSPASIISVDIMLKEDGPMIVAATTSSLILVSWSKAWKTNHR